MNNKILNAHIYNNCGVFVTDTPCPSAEIGAKLALGVHPHTLFPQLKRKDACSFVVQERFRKPNEWLWNRLQQENPVLKNNNAPKYIKVCYWVESVLKSPLRRNAFLRERGAFFGDTTEGSILSRLDEISPMDLHKSVTRTILNAIENAFKKKWKGNNVLIEQEHLPNWYSQLPKSVSLLTTAKELYEEGQVMRHCIFSYAADVASNKGWVFSLKPNNDERSTLYITQNCLTVQHKAQSNKNPSQACLSLADQVLNILQS